MTAIRKGVEGVELDNDVHHLQQMMLGVEGKEFWVQARVKSWVTFGAIAVVYFVVRRLWTRSIDVDVPGVPLTAAYLLMKIVTPQVPIEAHAMAAYREVRRLILGWLHRRRSGGCRVAPYSLLGRTAKTPRTWPWTRLLARANERRNRTDA